MRHETAVPVGAGGMGEVYRAWDPDLERWVALKYLRTDSPEMVQRLLREARAQARIDHPGVCRVYEVGEADGRPFIAMQYVDGRPLDEAAAGLPLEAKVLLVQRAAEAVHAAHSAGVIHRDLKPGNILVECVGDDGLLPRVVDFGLAREHEAPGLTRTGEVLGTPAYMAPEQARGDVHHVDRRTDVYALGVVLYELVTGAPPFVGDSSVGVLLKVLEEEPRPLRAVDRSVPVDLETVVMHCLEKEPQHRYPSARALADDLGRFLAGEPVAARPRSRLARLATRARKHPRTSAALVALALAVLALAGLAWRASATGARRERLARRFGQEVERLAGALERAHLLPLHDVRPERAKVRRGIAEIDAAMTGLAPASRAVGEEAAGHCELALGDAEAARERLQVAWDLGHHAPRVAYALGLSLARLYGAALDEAVTIHNQAVRADSLRKAEAAFGKPARGFLERGGGGAEHPGYLAATLDVVTGDDAGALAELAHLKSSEPFFYQGDLLAGEIHRRAYQAASERGATDAAQQAFAAAVAAFSAAAEVGTSDPRPYEELCSLWVQAMRLQFYGAGGDMRPARDAALAACDKALVANPDSVAAHLESGRAQRYWASAELERGHDATTAIAAARAQAEQVLAVDPDNENGFILLGVTHRMAADVLAGSGGDPGPELRAAVDAYREAIRLRPDDYSAHTSLANAWLRLGAFTASHGGDPAPAFEAAAEVAARAVALQPRLVAARVNLGIAYAQLAIAMRDHGGEADAMFERGAAALRKAIDLNPRFYTAHFNLGELLIEQAVGTLRRGQDPTPQVKAGFAMLDSMLAANPTFAASHFLEAEGWALLAEYARLNGGNPAPPLERAHAALQAGRADRANDPEGLVLASLANLVEARWRCQQGRDPAPAVAAGVALVDQALAANATLAQAWLRRGELHLVAAVARLRAGSSPGRELAAAAGDLEHVRAVAPDDPALATVSADLWRCRGEWLRRRGDDATAAVARGLDWAARALREDPSRAAAWGERAALEWLAAAGAEPGARREQRTAAAAAWREAQRRDPLIAIRLGITDHE